MHTNSTLSEQDKLVLHWGAALTVGAQDSYKIACGPRTWPRKRAVAAHERETLTSEHTSSYIKSFQER